LTLVDGRDAGWRGVRPIASVAALGTVFVALLLTASSAWAVPANDNFADSVVLSGMPVFENGSNVVATKETGEPNHAGDPGGASVWYAWTAPASGPVSVDTCVSGFDTLVGVYTGTSVGALTEVAANDQSDGPICEATDQSELVFNATAGTSYRIAVDGWSDNGASAPDLGSFLLRIRSAAPPPNDDFANAAALQDLGNNVYGVHGSNEYASRESGEPEHAGGPGGGSVWYRWTAPLDAVATVNTCNTDFDTLLAAYSGSSLGALTGLGFNDDGDICLGNGSRFSFRAIQGATYSIAVDGLFDDRGEFDLLLQSAPVAGGCMADCGPGTARARIRKVKVNSQKRTATVYFSANQPGATFICQLDDGVGHPCRSPVTLGRHKPWARLRPGKHWIHVVAVDSAGRTEPRAVNRKFRIPRH
jgi:hypothetical protein